jgi:hypothetical protein
MGFYGGAYAQPLQRQTILGSGVDEPQMEGGYAAPAQAPSLGQPTAGPSRFQSILGSLGQWAGNANSGAGRANNLRTVGGGIKGLFTL